MGKPRPPGIDAAEMLASILAVLLIERDYETESSAALPLELVLTDGVPCKEWAGWNGHKRSVRNRLRDLANREFRLELSLGRDYEQKQSKSNKRSGARRSLQFKDLTREPTQVSRAFEQIESTLAVNRVIASMTAEHAKIVRLCLRAEELGVPEDQLFQQAGLRPATARKAKQRLKPILRILLAA
jgi:hypothetical protein